MGAVDAVLANSSHEPFGYVALETMSAGGVAGTGCTGEEYAVHGQNALVLQSTEPDDFVTQLNWLRARPEAERRLRRSARTTAEQFSWHRILDATLMSRIEACREQVVADFG
jgi:glycosyltransferase involved in cell wall biosynthesis